MMSRFLCLLLCLASLPLQAAYITDRIAVGLYKELPKKANAPHFATLYSGDEIKKVLEQKENFTKVELADGRQGWIGRQYLSDEMPAVLELIESRKQVLELSKKLEQSGRPGAETAETGPYQELRAAYKKMAELEARLKEKTAKPAAAKPGSQAECEKQLEAMESKQLQCQVQLAKYIKNNKDEVIAENEKLRDLMQQAISLLNLPVDGEVPLMIPASALISLAQAAPENPNLKQDQKSAPSTQDGLPGWVYFIFLLALLTGGIAGFAFFDYRSRLRYPG